MASVAAAPVTMLRRIVTSGVTSFIGVSAVAVPMHLGVRPEDMFLLIGPLGASAALVFGAPEAPFAQPRNVVFGQMICAATGVAWYKLGHLLSLDVWLTAPCAVSTAIMAMLATGTMHPPGGGTALLAVIGGASVHDLGWLFAVAPCGTSASVLVITGVVTHNMIGTYKYPSRWW